MGKLKATMTTWTAFEPPPEAATGSDFTTQQADKYLEAPDSIYAHITFNGSLRTAPLEHYIVLAVQRYLPEHTRGQIFRRAPEVSPPILRSDQENRILVFPSAFTPPHHGHTGLLWHTYLSLNDKIIAAMILPMKSSSVFKKRPIKGANEDDDRKFALNSNQRRQLWQDKVLSRFVWMWPADKPDGVPTFLKCI